VRLQQSYPKMQTAPDSSQAEGASLERCCSASSAQGTACTEAQRQALLACLATSNLKCSLGIPSWAPPAALLRKCERLQIAGSQKEQAWKAVAQPHLPMALLAQRHRDWGCLLVLPLKLQTYICEFVQGASGSPPPQMRTSSDSSQAERASLESCCSASSAHGTVRTEAQRLGLLACLASSNFKHTFGGLCRGPLAALLRKCERLQIVRSQKELAWKAVAQPHLPMALLAQRHRDWDCLLVLPPPNSNVD